MPGERHLVVKAACEPVLPGSRLDRVTLAYPLLHDPIELKHEQVWLGVEVMPRLTEHALVEREVRLGESVMLRTCFSVDARVWRAYLAWGMGPARVDHFLCGSSRNGTERDAVMALARELDFGALRIPGLAP